MAFCIIALFVPTMVYSKVPKTKTDTKVIENIYKEISWNPAPRGAFPTGTYQTTTKTVNVPQRASVQVTDNENTVWNYLIAQGFTRNQVAGIMGNLQQEHGFQTSGDGIAQWIGGRKSRLLSMEDPYSINTQLSFLMIELNEGIRPQITATDDLVSVVRLFQNQFERCGICNEAGRINYAYAILARH